jgi:hypothetical protein
MGRIRIHGMEFWDGIRMAFYGWALWCDFVSTEHVIALL